MKPAILVIVLLVLGLGGLIVAVAAEGEDGPGPVPPHEKLIEVVSRGKKIDIPSLLDPNRFTVLEFWKRDHEKANRYGKQLHELAERTRAFRIQRVDIDEWGSVVCEQLLIRDLPKWWLYKGTVKVTSDRRFILDKFDR